MHGGTAIPAELPYSACSYCRLLARASTAPNHLHACLDARPTVLAEHKTQQPRPCHPASAELSTDHLTFSLCTHSREQPTQAAVRGACTAAWHRLLKDLTAACAGKRDGQHMRTLCKTAWLRPTSHPPARLLSHTRWSPSCRQQRHVSTQARSGAGDKRSNFLNSSDTRCVCCWLMVHQLSADVLQYGFSVGTTSSRLLTPS